MASQRSPMLYKLVSLLPKNSLVFLSGLRNRFPFLGKLFRKAVGGQMVGTILHGPAKGMILDTSGAAVGYLLGTPDQEEQEVLARLLKPGATVFDIGANIGVYVLLSGRIVGAQGHVFAFEPFPESANAIRRNVDLNHLQNVTIIESAVSNTVGTVKFSVGETAVTHQIMKDTPDTQKSDFIIVPVTTVDAFVGDDSIKMPSLMIVDVEQAEISVLRGALETIKKARPTLLVEVHWLGKEFTDYVNEHIIPMGYQAATLEGQPLPTESVRYHAVLRPVPVSAAASV